MKPRDDGSDGPMMEDEDYLQRVVLDEFRKHHPAKLTMAELELTMKVARRPGDDLPDTIVNAVKALEGDGLVREVGGEYGLTRPAARMAEFPDR
jgi:hypothetical protein